jgi:hypothetical protein
MNYRKSQITMHWRDGSNCVVRVFFSENVLTRVPQQINGKPVFSKTTAAYKVGQVKT